MTQPLRIDPSKAEVIALAIEGDRIYWDKNVNGSKDAGEPFLLVEQIQTTDGFTRPASDLPFALSFILVAFVMGVTATKLWDSRDAPKDAPADRS